ncbi:hypothetical protein [Curtobacterium sp. VKM Ac-1376]|uniref:hypothetical protein n=1 Tax=Curtobacterium sp. VKM Ac-1376 TaxID=123312 RepID=UPI00188B79A8|nr:hypothetical protein [Curtobacterium sp. VKM Ac-1376]MBF4613319.1 hypothetical protein [Curtobacterium sp. VKM Ac-1376]
MTTTLPLVGCSTRPAPDTRPGLHVKRLTDEKTNFQYSTSRVTQKKTRALVTALERLIRTVHERT